MKFHHVAVEGAPLVAKKWLTWIQFLIRFRTVLNNSLQITFLPKIHKFHGTQDISLLFTAYFQKKHEKIMYIRDNFNFMICPNLIFWYFVLPNTSNKLTKTSDQLELGFERYDQNKMVKIKYVNVSSMSNVSAGEWLTNKVASFRVLFIVGA